MSQTPEPIISLRQFLPPESTAGLQWLAGVMDRLTGISHLNRYYRQHQFHQLSAPEFLHKTLQVMDWQVQVNDPDLAMIPRSGGFIIVANHPFGGSEGVLIAWLLSQIRPDIKILANQALRIFPELAPYFIFTNPLKPGAAGNLTSLRQCQKHVAAGGLLVIFPAGRVSYPQHFNSDIKDHPWDRFAVTLSQYCQCPLLPVFIAGTNRKRFYWLGQLHYRFRLLMLVREMLASRGKAVSMRFSPHPIHPSAQKDIQMNTDLSRLLTYLQDPAYRQTWPAEEAKDFLPVAGQQATTLLCQEISALPEQQLLVSYKHYRVYFARRTQCPTVVEEIRRLREICFREYDEGSGQPQDGDLFDDSYVQLFVFDTLEQQIIGAYRMGRTDQLLAADGIDGLYLSRMFEFHQGFLNRQHACLEMGRSFVINKHQKSFHALLLLFRGIAGFVSRHPQYQTLYGTVSLSKQYDPLSVLLISRMLTKPSTEVTARKPFSHPEHPELTEFLSKHQLTAGTCDIELLDMLVRQIEPDGKGLPVLVRQYHQLGARFYCVGIDPNFASTPGLLLSVHLKTAPYKQLKLFFGEALSAFLGTDTNTEGPSGIHGEPA